MRGKELYHYRKDKDVLRTTAAYHLEDKMKFRIGVSHKGMQQFEKARMEHDGEALRQAKEEYNRLIVRKRFNCQCGKSKKPQYSICWECRQAIIAKNKTSI